MDRMVQLYRLAQRRGDLVTMRIMLSRGGMALMTAIVAASR
jgi:hypothetical protein